MMSYYNLTNASAVNPFVHLTVMNNVTDGLIGILILASVYLIMAIAFRNQGTKVSFTMAGFGSAFMGVLFWGAGLLPFTYLVWVFLAFMISLLVAVFAE